MIRTQPNFWHLFRPHTRRDTIDHDGGMDWESIRCPINPGHQRAGRRITDLQVIVRRTSIDDFNWLGVTNEWIVQDRVLHLLNDSGVTGFEVKPVQARFERSDVTPPPLWEIVVTGWADMAKPESGIELDKLKSCAACGHLRYTGLQKPEELIDKSKWDGSDFFMVWPLPRYLFVTDRVVNMIRDHHLTGVNIMPTAELKQTEGFSPGRLNYYMPDAKAKRLGEPLGIY